MRTARSPELRLITDPRKMQVLAEGYRRAGDRVGVVLTMGYLHEGHLSLVRIARQRSDVVITTAFVNPTQFAPHEDLTTYPQDLERDKRLASSAGTDILFRPDSKDIYPEGYLTHVDVGEITNVLEGKFRPTHFRGVTTIVAKMFNLTKPHVAVFGQKDAQQAVVVRQMARDLDFDVEIVIGPTVREDDGLAMSSRNVYLSGQERRDAPVLYASLLLAENMVRGGERSSGRVMAAMQELISDKPSATVEYISIADSQRLSEVDTLRSGQSVLVSLAARIGSTRLIDNTLITVGEEPSRG